MSAIVMSPHLEQLEHIEAHVVVGEAWVEDLEVHVVHVLRDQARDLRRLVAHNIKQRDDVWAASKVLQDLDFALDLLLLDRLEDLDDALLLGHDVYALEDLRGGKY